ncbi:MAG: hypothetical protein RL758_478 [Pseudomonadota bacterium]|jgi:hypothetical protein
MRSVIDNGEKTAIIKLVVVGLSAVAGLSCLWVLVSWTLLSATTR